MLTVFILKIVRFFLQISRRGRGTSLPGLIGEKYFYKSLSKLPKQLDQIIVITGTNGKTTTSKIVRTILKQNNIKVLSNISGANLTRGILAALAFDTNIFGKLKSKVAVFEVEEASMEKVVNLLNPDIVLVTNLYRDQMDAYGELDHTREVIENGLKNMKEDSIVLLNGNDPKVLYMNRVCKGKVNYYGLQDLNIQTDEENSIPDSFKSPVDRTDLEYSKIYYSHIGIFKSKDGKFKTPILDFSVNNYSVLDDENKLPKVSFELLNNKDKSKEKIVVSDFKLLGLYNVINCVAAFSIIESLFNNIFTKDISSSSIKIQKQDYSKISAAFGRGEKIKLKHDNTVTLILVKNPTGFNSALSAINEIKDKYIVLGLNDNTADGKDVSWIWDCNFEALREFKKIIVTGERAADLALRCKYAELPYTLVEDYLKIIPEFIEYKGEDGLIKEKKNIQVFALCSYTSLLDFRKNLSEITKLKNIEEEI